MQKNCYRNGTTKIKDSYCDDGHPMWIYIRANKI